MPLYVYFCFKCGKKSDYLQKIGARRPAKCQLCGNKGKLHKLPTKAAFILKGSGFYKNDYGKAGRYSSDPHASEHLKDPYAPDDMDLELLNMNREEYEWAYGNDPKYAHETDELVDKVFADNPGPRKIEED